MTMYYCLWSSFGVDLPIMFAWGFLAAHEEFFHNINNFAIACGPFFQLCALSQFWQNSLIEIFVASKWVTAMLHSATGFKSLLGINDMGELCFLKGTRFFGCLFCSLPLGFEIGRKSSIFRLLNTGWMFQSGWLPCMCFLPFRNWKYLVKSCRIIWLLNTKQELNRNR